jgi:hypothetical protein
MLVEPCQLKQGKGKFCSHSCTTIYNNKIISPQSGSGNHNWKGGISNDKVRYKRIQQQRYPQRMKCRKLLSDAVRCGRIIKEPCEKCGSNKDVHAHHDDYSKPYEIRWLCRPCHREHHKNKEASCHRESSRKDITSP